MDTVSTHRKNEKKFKHVLSQKGQEKIKKRIIGLKSEIASTNFTKVQALPYPTLIGQHREMLNRKERFNFKYLNKFSIKNHMLLLLIV